ncbi:MAG: arginine--tRNA ligase, partial [Sphingobacteriales bacterium]
VGKYYVIFDKEYKKQIEALKAEGQTEDEAKKNAPLIKEAQLMLLQWERGDEEVINLWKTMNSWVYAGFADTYKALGVDFDKYYYESNTYLLGKDIIDEGLEKGVFFKKEDGSVWIDLTPDGLDEKLVLRSDGTSVYITQDLGTAQLKYNDFHMDRSIYVVGNEQDYHFKVLFLILQKLGKAGANGLFHLSYGMVDLPSGKMKSREGTVVDADDLMAEMEQTAKDHTEALGKVESFSDTEKQQLYHTIGMGALKYFLLKVDPKKRLLFDPAESVDFQGHTGPFIQYTHARIRSVLSRADVSISDRAAITELSTVERDLIVLVNRFPEVIQEAAAGYSPAVVANYVYELAKSFNKFYHEKSILQAEDEVLKQF